MSKPPLWVRIVDLAVAAVWLSAIVRRHNKRRGR